MPQRLADLVLCHWEEDGFSELLLRAGQGGGGVVPACAGTGLLGEGGEGRQLASVSPFAKWDHHGGVLRKLKTGHLPAE